MRAGLLSVVIASGCFVIASGCGFDHGASPGGGGSGSDFLDGSVDAPPDSPPGTSCFGNGVVRVCLAAPTAAIAITVNTTIDTVTSSRCAALVTGSNIDACVIAGAGLDIQAGVKLVGTGARPLVIVSTSSISVAGTIDVASHRGGTVGAGADPSACAMGTPPTYSNSGGGGYGGSFGSVGGTGGDGESGTGGTPAAAISTVTALRGGCPGSAGADILAGAGGHGGGAVYLIATGSIAISGTINASGAGGGGGTDNDSGGGGGGAGGMIGLEAPTVTVSSIGRVFANGGGGGEGNEMFFGANGGDPATPTPAAGGGAGGSFDGGDGGDGSQKGAGANGKNGASSGGGGGGGGGGHGVIVVVPDQNLGGTVMPDPI